MPETEHDVRDVQLETDDNRFVLLCHCGWRSDRFESVKGAVVAWQVHRDGS